MGRSRVAALFVIVAVAALALVSIGRPAATDDAARSTQAVAKVPPLPPTPRPRPSPRATVPTQPVPGATPNWEAPQFAFDDAIGYWYGGPGSFKRLYGSKFGECLGATDFCPISVGVQSGSPVEGVAFTQAGAQFHVKGRTLRALRRAWVTLFGDTDLIDMTVDGERAFFAHSGQSDTADIAFGSGGVIVLHAGRLFVLDVEAWLGDAERIARQFVPDFHFMTPDCWLQPCTPDRGDWVEPSPLLAFDAERAKDRWQPLGNGLGFEPGPEDRSTRSFVLPGDCVDNLCSGFVDVSTGTLSTGAVVRGRQDSYGTWVYDRIQGAKLETLADSWESLFGPSTVVRTELEGVPALRITGPTTVGGPFGAEVRTPGPEALVVILRDRVVVVMARVGFIGPPPKANLDSFLAGLQVLP